VIRVPKREMLAKILALASVNLGPLSNALTQQAKAGHHHDQQKDQE
jgi:hypothetical protein